MSDASDGLVSNFLYTSCILYQFHQHNAPVYPALNVKCILQINNVAVDVIILIFRH